MVSGRREKVIARNATGVPAKVKSGERNDGSVGWISGVITGHNKTLRARNPVISSNQVSRYFFLSSGKFGYTMLCIKNNTPGSTGPNGLVSEPILLELANVAITDPRKNKSSGTLTLSTRRVIFLCVITLTLRCISVSKPISMRKDVRIVSYGSSVIGRKAIRLKARIKGRKFSTFVLIFSKCERSVCIPYIVKGNGH